MQCKAKQCKAKQSKPCEELCNQNVQRNVTTLEEPFSYSLTYVWSCYLVTTYWLELFRTPVKQDVCIISTPGANTSEPRNLGPNLVIQRCLFWQEVGGLINIVAPDHRTERTEIASTIDNNLFTISS